jgi:hypothetical protein
MKNWRRQEMPVQTENEDGQGGACHHHVGDPPREEKTKPKRQVIDRFQQKLADVAVLDVSRNLPIILVHRRQGVDDGRQQVIGNHLSERVSPNHRPHSFAGVNRPPHIEHGDQWNQSEQCPRQKVKPVRQVVLNANINDIPVLFHAISVKSSIRSAQHKHKPSSRADFPGPARWVGT